MKELIPEAFKTRQILPEHLIIPDELTYSYMIHVISKTHGVPVSTASAYTELDYWQLASFENLDSAKEEYLIRKFKNE